jgi:tetratricopeptide (TPR) repeat protein
MAGAVKDKTSLDCNNGYADFFKRRVVESTHRWQLFVTEKKADPAALEQRQGRILRTISFALASAVAWPAASQLIEAFAPYMERRGYWDTWHDILNQAIEAAARFDDTTGQVTLMALLARLRQRQSHFREAVSLYREVIRLARHTGNRFEEARACSNLGFLYLDAIGHWQRAEVLCCHALATFEKLGSEHGQAHTENHLGVLYTRQRSWGQAEQHLQRACALWQAMGDHHSLVYGFENLGLLYLKMERPLEAHTYLERALTQTKLTGEEAEIGNICNNIGLVYGLSGDLDKAEAYAKRAEEVFRRFSNILGLARSWHNLGFVSLHQEKWAEAIHYLEHSLAIYRRLNNWEDEIGALLDIVEYELARGNQMQTAARLNEVEQLIAQHTRGRQQQYLNEHLEKYRRSLTKLEAWQTTAILDS